LGHTVEVTTYKQGFRANAEVFVMDEGIEMMPIEQISEQQYPWWVGKVSTGDDKIVASFKACACGQRQHFARFGERGMGRTLQQAEFELIRQVNQIF
jgi:hypothetical protein